MSAPRWGLAVSLAACVLVLACGSDSSTKPAGRDVPRGGRDVPRGGPGANRGMAAPPIDAAPPPPVADRAGVVVTSVGIEPRRTLRYAIAPGPPAPMASVAVDLKVVSAGDGDRSETSAPFVFDVAAGATAIEGGVRANLLVRSVTVGDPVHMGDVPAEQVRRTWAAGAGSFIGLPLSPVGPPPGPQDGLAPPVVATPAAAAPPIAPSLVEVASVLQAVAVTWPDQPIGPGATWRVERLVAQPVGPRGDTAFVKHVTDYTLDGLDGDLPVVSFTSKRSQLDGGAPRRYPHSVRALEFELRSFEGTATGKATIDLSRPLPVRETILEKTTLRLQLFAAGAPLTGGLLQVDKQAGVTVHATADDGSVPPPAFAPRTDGAYCAKPFAAGLLECLRFLPGGVVVRADSYTRKPIDNVRLLSMHARESGNYTGPWFATDVEVIAATAEVEGKRTRYQLAAAADRLTGTRVGGDGKKTKATYTFVPMTFEP